MLNRFKMQMSSFFLKLIFCSSTLFILPSCVTTKYVTKNELIHGTESYYIARHEVSIGDWLAYILATSFTEKNATITLSDHPDKIYSKLPVLEPGTWSSYTINAFLKRSQRNASAAFYTECKHHIAKIAVEKHAWDSIQKYHLLDLPIVGITYDQALDFIAYKQEVFNSCVVSKEPYDYKCVLPSPDQFAAIQTVMDSTNSDGCNLFNYKNSLCPDCPIGIKYAKHPVFHRIGVEPSYTWSYFPDPLGLKNLKGNVAEMTSVKGVALGGSCQHYASEAFHGKRQEYVGLAGWLGFRVWYRRIPKESPTVKLR